MISRSLRRVGLCGLVLAAVTLPLRAEEPKPWRWDGVERVVVVGDVHGAYDSLVGILRQAKMIDSEGVWIGGEDHLVMLGDLVDRGPDSRKALTLIMRLQYEAERAGGRVHLVLGNHEVMNVVGELSYTNPSEFAAFAKEDDPKQRKAALKRMLGASVSQNKDLGKMRKVFAKRYPPGYFGHRDAFSADGLYGGWLLDQSILVVVNDVAFVHGGLPPMLLGMDPDQINSVAMAELRSFVEAQQRLEDLGVLGPEMAFKQQLGTVSAILEDPNSDPEVVAPAEQLFLAAEGMVFRRDGPLWYRGLALNPEADEQELVDEMLAHLGADRVVIGHTPVHTDRITTRFNGAVVMADTGMLTEHYGGRASALEMTNGVVAALYTGQGGEPLEDQRWDLTAGLFGDADELATFLESASVVHTERVGAGSTDPRTVILADNGRRCRAIFKDIDQGDRHYTNEVAAYRLDRMLGLGMVPPTVVRRINGATGSLQAWVENAINEEDRLAEDLSPEDDDDFEEQRDHAGVFDVLIFNIDRNGSNTLITTSDWQIHLIDHEQALKPSVPSPYHLDAGRAMLDEEFAAVLAGLDAEAVHAELGGLLSEEQIDALLERRDLLLDDGS